MVSATWSSASVPVPSLTAARRFCRELTWKAAKNFYYAFLFLSQEQREAAFAIYAFCRVADDISDDESRPEAERLADLADFEEALDRCLRRERVSHPVFVALRDVLERTPVPDRGFKLMLEGVRQDLSVHRYATFADLEEYCFKVASTVALLLMPIFDPDRQGDGEEYVRTGGVAVQLTNIIRDVAEDAERGRIYLPAEDLERFEVSEEEILACRPTEGIRALLAFEADRALHLYEEADRLISARDRRHQIVLETSRAIYRRLLDRIKEQRFDVFCRRISLSPIEKLATSLGVRASGWLAR